MSSKTMIDTDDPQHWPGDPGAVIEATSDERAARYVNTWFETVLSWTLINRDDINLPLFTADDIRATTGDTTDTGDAA